VVVTDWDNIECPCVIFSTFQRRKQVQPSTMAGKKFTAVTAYLVAYNAVCVAGWAYCLFLVFTAYQAGSTPAQLWVDLRDPLTVSLLIYFVFMIVMW